MNELEEAKRTVGVHVKNPTWLTGEQFLEIVANLQNQTNHRLEKLTFHIDDLKKLPETGTAQLFHAGEYIDLEPYDRGHITLAIDGDGEAFEATVIVLYQARNEGEFIPAKLVNGDGLVVSEATSSSSFYKVLAPQGQTIRAIMKSYAYGEVYVTLSANYTGSN